MMKSINQNPQLAQLQRIIKTVKSARNPQAMINQMLQSNPQYNQIMDFVNRNGGNLENAFYAMAKQKGVNPNDILNLLK